MNVGATFVTDTQATILMQPNSKAGHEALLPLKLVISASKELSEQVIGGKMSSGNAGVHFRQMRERSLPATCVAAGGS